MVVSMASEVTRLQAINEHAEVQIARLDAIRRAL
jgi:hypothetical protein